jgi:hypothetical protein
LDASSDFPLGHGAFAVGRFRDVGFCHPFASPAAGIEAPFTCELALEVTVDVDELEDVEDTDEEECVR